MMDENEKINIDILNKELKRIEFMLKYNHEPYVFIVSDEKN